MKLEEGERKLICEMKKNSGGGKGIKKLKKWSSKVSSSRDFWPRKFEFITEAAVPIFSTPCVKKRAYTLDI